MRCLEEADVKDIKSAYVTNHSGQCKFAKAGAVQAICSACHLYDATITWPSLKLSGAIVMGIAKIATMGHPGYLRTRAEV